MFPIYIVFLENNFYIIYKKDRKMCSLYPIPNQTIKSDFKSKIMFLTLEQGKKITFVIVYVWIVLFTTQGIRCCVF